MGGFHYNNKVRGPEYKIADINGLMTFKAQPVLFGKFARSGVCGIGVTTVQAARSRLKPKATSVHLSQRTPAYISATDKNQPPAGNRARFPGVLLVDACIRQGAMVDESDKSLFGAKLLVHPLAQRIISL